METAGLLFLLAKTVCEICYSVLPLGARTDQLNLTNAIMRKPVEPTPRQL